MGENVMRLDFKCHHIPIVDVKSIATVARLAATAAIYVCYVLCAHSRVMQSVTITTVQGLINR
jgi:hypothetical protein